jgi:DNA adenine methylase
MLDVAMDSEVHYPSQNPLHMAKMTNLPLPHPIPYQGSKRNLASRILDLVYGHPFKVMYEPFAGSAATTIAAANAKIAKTYVIGDSLSPLIDVWRGILNEPSSLSEEYCRIWNGQEDGGEDYYIGVREDYNRNGDPAKLLYLLARCVKNAPRWNKDGKFNQSADKRRLGMRPEKMRREIMGVNGLLSAKTIAVAGDFEDTILGAGSQDLVYMDPPWEGTSGGRDTRYHQGLQRERLLSVLEKLNVRGVPWILSYDGRCGDKTYGEPLPKELKATLIELHAGRSSQATLNGHDAITIESLYVSSAISQKAQPVMLIPDC